MNVDSLRGMVVTLGLLIGIGVGGWVIGAELIASEAAAPESIRVSVGAAAGPRTSGVLVIPRSGLSPFGHLAGLVGRQILVGRVVRVEGNRIVVGTATGEATVTLDDSTFLLRLSGSSEDVFDLGATVAILTRDTDGGGLSVSSALVLPLSSQPVIKAPPDGPGFGGGDGAG